MRAMFSSEMPLGHSASQAPVFEQAPKPSSSICATIASARFAASTLPWGNSANCEILAEVNNIADAFLQEILLHPSDYDVVAALNLNGDYMSDALAAQAEALGMRASQSPVFLNLDAQAQALANGEIARG